MKPKVQFLLVLNLQIERNTKKILVVTPWTRKLSIPQSIQTRTHAIMAKHKNPEKKSAFVSLYPEAYEVL